MRTVQRGHTHVLDRIGVRPQGDVVDEAVDRADQEAAHHHLKFAEPVFVALLLLITVVVPQRPQYTAEHVNRACAVRSLGGSNHWRTVPAGRAGTAILRGPWPAAGRRSTGLSPLLADPRRAAAATSSGGTPMPRSVNRRAAVSCRGRVDGQLSLFFACLCYAGLRPGGVVVVHRSADVDLTADGGWGRFACASLHRAWVLDGWGFRAARSGVSSVTARSRGPAGSLPPGPGPVAAQPCRRVRYGA